MTLKRLLIASAAAAMLASPDVAIGQAEELSTHPETPGRTKATEVVELAPGSFEFPVPGEFQAEGRPASAPVVEQRVPTPLAIMKYQVSQAEYQRCVEAGACKAADATIAADADTKPVTGVNFLDAQAYARWFSEQTGERWRLPTDAEWAYAAGERFVGETYSAVASDPDNPAVAWIRRYREESAARREPDPVAHERGHFGANTHGITDLAGNVWEWTSTCYARTTLDGVTGEVVHSTENCRVHIAEGRHRAYMSDFVRDGVSGGCAVGIPPDNLGFRLVREVKRSLPERLFDALRSAFLNLTA